MVDAKTSQFLTDFKRENTFKRRVFAFLPILILLVVLVVFWWLKLTGITITADAFCGFEEHIHTAECFTDTYTCALTEHKHTGDCYPDLTADVETFEDWEATLSGISPTLDPADKLTEIAQSQLGYKESERNFKTDADHVRHGYTRYGEWFGNPYAEWSAMFTSFCLRYAGFDEVPVSAGDETMRLAWIEKDIYKSAGEHFPIPGNIVFLDADGNGSADSTAVVTALDNGILYVIEGDVENSVRECAYEVRSLAIMGYGIPSAERHAVIMMNASPAADRVKIGNRINYSQYAVTSGVQFILYTQGTDGNYYAIDGNGNAVRVYVENNGSVYADSPNNSLIWNFTHQGTYDGQAAYYIQNASTGMYLHPHADDYTGVLNSVLSGRWESALYPTNNGVRIRGARQNAYSLLTNNSRFTATNSQYGSSVLYFAAMPARYNVWLDGTNGGIKSLGGSLDSHYYVTEGESMTLPTSWRSPDKYSYTLRGWYDITANKYYAPGSTVVVTRDTVFYADWMASTYDIGQFNAQVSNTVSTNEFITIRLFDYSSLFNLLSESVSTTISSSSHTETWSLITNGNNPYNGNRTLNFIFRDWDRGNEDISYPKNHNAINNPTNAGSVYSGLYTDTLGDLLFNPETSFDPQTGTGVIGKQYIGTGDHLFKLMTDPNNEHYGYYYYDSERNAASYNKSDGRFYVYDYLECTIDSSRLADFLPLNSPYANTNGKNVTTYSANGVTGEYRGVTHYKYDSGYNDGNNSTSNVGTNYWFGMSVDVGFYLPNSPGTIVDGAYGNRDVYGNEMHFQFSGDDDVWVLVDGKIVLDLGGIHGIESGDINFSTGVVTVNGTQTGNIYSMAPGEHTLTIYYLERGSSLSNCAIYFNLAPRFSLDLQKEDVLTAELLNGAEFSVFTNAACTVPAELWHSEKEYKSGVPSKNTFTVVDGKVSMWGFGAGNVYYVKETSPPDIADYSTSYGIIVLAFDSKGTVTYDVQILDDGIHDVSNGFTVHGFIIDDEKREAYITVTNAKAWVDETTSVSVNKVWGDTKNHSDDIVTVYLSVRDPDGTVRRIREVKLGAENSWTYTWDNLPKYYEDGVTKVEYLVEEAHVPGYVGTITKQSSGDTFSYRIKNDVLPSNNETAFTVYKKWDVGSTEDVVYEKFAVTVKLLANGVDTGRTVTLSLKNGWKDTFLALPYKDEEGNVIVYTVSEVWEHQDWIAIYGEITETNTSPPKYETTVTNNYRWGRGVELPSTGGLGQGIWIFSGYVIMTGAVISLYFAKRKNGRRIK